MYNILVVDDDKEIVNAIEIYLTKEGYNILKAYNGMEALKIVKENKDNIHLILLDIMMTKLDGVSTANLIRKDTAIPIIMLSAKSEDYDKITGLNNGADDYITKPFSIRELLARVKANLRRADVISNIEKEKKTSKEEGTTELKRTNVIKVGVLTLDLDRFEVMINDKIVDLTLREFEVLKFLASDPGQVITRETLLEKVWGYEYYGDIRTVDVTVRRIREKIEKDTSNPKILITKRGVGYYIAT